MATVVASETTFSVRVSGREVGSAVGLHNARSLAKGLVRDGYWQAEIFAPGEPFALEIAIRSDWGDAVLCGDPDRSARWLL